MAHTITARHTICWLYSSCSQKDLNMHINDEKGRLQLVLTNYFLDEFTCLELKKTNDKKTSKLVTAGQGVKIKYKHIKTVFLEKNNINHY